MKILRNWQVRWGKGIWILALLALFCANAAVARIAKPVWNATHAQIHDVPFENVDARLDINRATAEEFAELPGIGAVLAQRIADYRDAHGAFSDIEQLMRVPGIGEVRLSAIRSRIKVSPLS